jgi:hypothetical protein
MFAMGNKESQTITGSDLEPGAHPLQRENTALQASSQTNHEFHQIFHDVSIGLSFAKVTILTSNFGFT